MPFLTQEGETIPFTIEWNGLLSCDSLIWKEGQTIGEAVLESGDDCLFCFKMKEEILQDGWVPAKQPEGTKPTYSFISSTKVDSATS